MARFFDVFLPMESMYATARAVGVFLLVAGVALGGGLSTAQAYRDAIPGTFSYNVKVAIEKTQLALAPNDDYSTRLHAEFADRRIDELARLAEGNASAQAHIPATLGGFNREVAALGAGLDALKSSDPAGVIETAKLLERKMAVYQNTLRKVQALANASTQHDPNVYLGGSIAIVDGVTLKAMAVIVEHHVAGDTAASKNVVVTKFEDRIKDEEVRLEKAPAANTEQAKAAIAQAKQLIKEEKYEAALSKIVEVAKLTKEEEPGTLKVDPSAPTTTPSGTTPNPTVTPATTPSATPAVTPATTPAKETPAPSGTDASGQKAPEPTKPAETKPADAKPEAVTEPVPATSDSVNITDKPTTF